MSLMDRYRQYRRTVFAERAKGREAKRAQFNATERWLMASSPNGSLGRKVYENLCVGPK